MLVISENHINIDHVMWQPCFDCQVDCKGCYVSKSPTSRYTGPFKDEIIDLIYKEKKVGCHQFTISMDTTNRFKHEMGSVLKRVWGIYQEGERCNCETTTKFEGLPELCVTAYNLETVAKWCREMMLSLKDFLSPLTTLSLSNLPSNHRYLFKLCKETKTILNYNKMIGPGENLEALAVKSYNVDQTYLVLQKSSLGQAQDPEAIRRWVVARQWVKAEKLKDDVCMQDSSEFLKSGTKCGAGINKIHIWPDGSATGCPYDSMHITTGWKNMPEGYDVWKAIRTAIVDRDQHSMACCKIPEALEALREKRIKSKQTVVYQ